MEESLNHYPCGLMAISKDGNIQSINKKMLYLLQLDSSQVVGQHINIMLPTSSRLLFQLYFFPIIEINHQVEELQCSFMAKDGTELPVLFNASYEQNEQIYCVILPTKKRNQYENQLIYEKKQSDDAYEKKNKAFLHLEEVLETLTEQKEKLLRLDQQNQKYKIDTTAKLQLAKKIQEKSLTDEISNEQIQIDTYYKASTELSGDIYGFYQVNPDQYVIILLDVMGHGVSSALISMYLQSLFHRLISTGIDGEIVIKELDNHLQQLFYSSQDNSHYCSAVYLKIDLRKQTIEYINAGHPAVIYQDTEGMQTELRSSSPPIGTFEGLTFQKRHLDYTPGSRLLLYTDGVSESLELNRLHALLKENPSDSLSQLKKSIIHTIKTEGVDHGKNDDQCFILIDLK